MKREKLKRFFFLKDEDIGPRLRKKMIAVNLAGIALLSLMAWSRGGYPLPTAEMEFRRLERTNLIEHSEIVFMADGASKDLWNLSKEDRSCFAADGTELHMKGCWAVGVQGKTAVVARLRGERYMQSFPLDDGPVPVPFLGKAGLLEQTGYWIEEGPGKTGHPAYTYAYHGFVPFLLINAPEEAAGAELAIEMEGGVHACEGWRMENGTWMMGMNETWRAGIGMEAESRVDPMEWVNRRKAHGRPYTLRLYRADGSVLLEKSGRLGEA